MNISQLQVAQSSVASVSNNTEATAQQRTDQSRDIIQNQQVLGKDDFLQLLVTQLKYQDPSKPMEDTAFISQMAEFSALEQMTNMSKGFENLAGNLNSAFVLSLIGKDVEITNNTNVVSGKVNEVTLGSSPQVNVEGSYYAIDNISRVGNMEVQ